MRGWKQWLGSHWMGALSGLLVLFSLGVMARPWWSRGVAPSPLPPRRCP